MLISPNFFFFFFIDLIFRSSTIANVHFLVMTRWCTTIAIIVYLPLFVRRCRVAIIITASDEIGYVK